MIDLDFQPLSYGIQMSQSVMIAILHYPESQWGEDISIFVSLTEAGFTYEVQDFYGNDILIDPAYSSQPLTLGAAIHAIENLRPSTDDFSGNLELTLMGIPEVKSDFYPGLELYFLEKRKRLGLE